MKLRHYRATESVALILLPHCQESSTEGAAEGIPALQRWEICDWVIKSRRDG